MGFCYAFTRHSNEPLYFVTRQPLRQKGGIIMNERKPSTLLRAGALLLAAVMVFGNLYLPGGIFATKAAEAGWNNLSSPLTEDFEDHVVDTSGPFSVSETSKYNPTDAEATIVQNSAGNKMLSVNNKKAAVNSCARMNFRINSGKFYTDTVHLSYWLAVANKEGRFYIPTLTRYTGGGDGPAVLVAFDKGDVWYQAEQNGTPLDVTYVDETDNQRKSLTYEPNQWMFVEQIYTCGTNGQQQVSMYIDGKLLEITALAQDSIGGLSMWMPRDMGNQVAYVDNITVTEGSQEHKPMAMPDGGIDIPATDISFTDDAGEQISELAVQNGTTTALNVEFTPGYANTAMTITSSDTSVAEVDANGKLVAKKVGTTTITATMNATNPVTAQLTVNVYGKAAADWNLLPLQEDFESQTLNTNGSFKYSGVPANVTVLKNSSGNLILAYGNGAGLDESYATLNFRYMVNGSGTYYNPVYASYWMSAPGNGTFYIPTLTKFESINEPLVFVEWQADGTFTYTTKIDGTGGAVKDENGEVVRCDRDAWILVEQSYNCETNTMTMKIDGKTLNIQHNSRNKITGLTLYATKAMGSQIVCLDNIKVTTSAHEPMPEPEGNAVVAATITGMNFVDASGAQISEMTVTPKSSTTLSLAFQPFYAAVEEVTFTSSDPSVADFVDGKLVAYKGGEIRVVATLKSNSEISAALTVKVDASAEGLPIEENFTNVTEGTGGNFTVTGPDAADATVCTNATGNKMLIVSNNGGSAHGYANLPFLNAAGETVVYGGTLYLSYWVATSEQDLFYLPSLSSGNNQAAVVVFWNNGNFKYSTNYSTWTDVTYKDIKDADGNNQVVTYKTNEWIKIEQIYTCKSNGVYSMTMKINGEEVILTPMDRSSLNCVSMRMPNGMGTQVAYVDNITVTEYPHTAMDCPDTTNNFNIPTAEISFVDASGQKTDTLTVMSMNPTQLNLGFDPIYATDRTVTFSSSDKTVADFDASGKLIGFKAGHTTVTATLNSNPAITAQVVVTVDTSNQALPVTEDFQQAAEGKSAPFTVSGTEDAYAYVFEKNNGNKLLQVSNTNTLEHGYATMPFVNKLGEQVSYNGTLYLSYWMAVDRNSVFYIPSFSSYTSGNNLAAYVMLRATGTFEYSTDRSTWKPVYYKETGNVATYGINEWILIEQEYTCGDNPTFVMRINGEEVNVEGIGRSSINCVSMYMTMWMKGQVAYIDNMTVSLVPHTPMAEPDENLTVATEGVGFVDADGKTMSSLTVNAQNPTKLNVVFKPLGATDRDVSITSSNPTVATVDDKGKVIGFENGEATITVTLRSDPTIKATLVVTVDVNDVESVTITNVDLKPDAEKADTYNMVVGDHGFASAVIAPADADYQTIVWTSSNPSVATVDSYGEVLALKPGTVTIKASTEQPKSTACDEFTVVVTEANVDKTYKVASVAQLQNAMDDIAAINAGAGMSGNIVIEMDDGYYYLTETLKFGPEHSGTNGYSVVIKAAENATPVISGAAVIEGTWTKVDGKDYYCVQVPKSVNSRQLFVNNVRGVRARSNAGLTNSTFIYDGSTNIGYACEDTYLASYKYAEDLELVFMEEWTQPRCGVARIDDNNDGTVSLIMDQPGWSGVGRTGQAVATKGGTSAKEDGPVWIENALELLDETGEWYLDTHTSAEYNILYYMPRPGEDLNTALVTMPTLDNSTDSDIDGADGALVEIAGTFTDEAHNYVDTQVTNIHFEGITFADTTWMRPSTNKGHSDAQNNYIRENTGNNDVLAPGAVLVEAANGIWFTGCTFTRLGINGLQMINGVQNSLIIGNHFFDISGNAITIGEPDTDEVNAYAQGLNLIKNNDILNNLIHNIGVDFGSSAAISVGYAAEMDMSYNELFNLPYSGWHIGYGWSNDFRNNTKNMRLEYNFVHDIMGMGIFDGGAIYTIGNTSGDGYNVITHNYIRNQMNETAALYADAGSTYYQFVENVVDISENPDWHNGAAKWSFTGPDNEHIHWIDNFATTSSHTISYYLDTAKADIIHENLTVSSDADWTDPVVADVIENAGLQDTYSYLRNGQAERIGVTADGAAYGGEELFLKTGDTVQLGFAVSAIRDGEEITDGLNYTYYYESRNPAVAEVDRNGLIVAKGTGITTVRLVVISNNVVDVKEVDLLVNDAAAIVELEEIQDEICITADAAGLQLTAVVTSTLGFERTPDSLTFGVSDKSIATVTEDGFLAPVAAGTTSVTVAAAYGGMSVYRVYKVVIKESANIPEINAGDMFDKESEGGWNRSNAANWSVVDDTSVSGKLNSYATFSGKEYENELLCFKLKIDKTGISSNWPSIVLRAQDADGEAPSGGTDGYVFCMGSNGIEVYRFVDGVRYVIRGSQAEDGSTVIHLNGIQGIIAPADSGFTYTDEVAEHDVKVGAINAGEYIRLLLYVDGVKVLDYLDSKVSGAITEPGYFGMIGRGQTFTLTKNTSISDDAGSGGTGGDDSMGTEGKAAQIGNETFDTLQDALDAAQNGSTVKLLADVEAVSVVLANNVNLDLNGYDLAVEYLVAFTGSSVVDSAPGAGLIKGKGEQDVRKNVKLPKNNDQMPVWDETAGGYRMFSLVSYQRFHKQTTDEFEFYCKPSLGDKVNDVFLKQSDSNGLTVKIRMYWASPSGNLVEQYFTFAAGDITDTYTDDNKNLYLKVTGAKNYANNLTVSAYIVSDTGVEWTPEPGELFVGQ